MPSPHSQDYSVSVGPSQSYGKYFAMVKDQTQGRMFDSLQDAEDWCGKMLRTYPHLKTAVYKLAEVGEISSPPISWTYPV